MRILLDENVPAQLARALPGHEVLTVPRMRWAGIKNGRLLRLAAGSFDVFVTIDRSIRHQQVLPEELAMIHLEVPDNKPETVIVLAPRILDELEAMRPGDSIRISAHR